MVDGSSILPPGAMNISKADLAKLDALLPTIGIDEKTAGMGGSVLGDAMLDVAKVIIEKLKQSVREKGVKATGNLLQSIRVDFPSVTPSGVSIGIEMADYYQWVEDGRRKGKRPPIMAIEQWISAKGIQVRQSKGESKQSVLERRKSMAEAIAKKIASKGTIKRFGYKGAGFIADVITQQNVDTIAQKLSDLTGLRLTAYITTEIAE
jgi:hypothetical protein